MQSDRSGNSDYPSEAQFKPTFANLADVMAYMRDFGGPVGFRLAVMHPEWIDGFIIQNANAYLEGIGPGENLQGMKDRFGTLTPQQRTEVEQLIPRNSGVPDRCTSSGREMLICL